MKLSIYTFVRNGIYFDYHFKEMLKHHLPLADEIIVNEGYSFDGSYEAITNIDSKIKVFRSHWEKVKDLSWYLSFKEEARSKCTGDWCILLDCDEFIPEWEFEGLRRYLEETDASVIPVQAINFFGNYKVYHAHPEKINWPSISKRIHRNLKEVKIVHDGCNVELEGDKYNAGNLEAKFTYHHFGCVRNPARLRQKWREIQWIHHIGKKPRFHLPGFLYDFLPFNWKDPAFIPDLQIYNGPYIKAVRENTDEFVRDNFILYDYLKNKSQRSHKLED